MCEVFLPSGALRLTRLKVASWYFSDQVFTWGSVEMVTEESNVRSVTSPGKGDSLPPKRARLDRPASYLFNVCGLAFAGLLSIFAANQQFASEMYQSRAAQSIGKALGHGKGHATFDLNVNIREIRDAQIAHMKATPDLAILGASHWQEAHSHLMPQLRMFNSHVHRDYYEDMLASTERFVRHGKMPNAMIISIRDDLFTPVTARRDHLWLPSAPGYRAMAKRLDVPSHSFWSTMPVQRWREQISMPMLYGNVARWYSATEHPHHTATHSYSKLDTLLADGSIDWSLEHRRLFTAERAEELAIAAAKSRADRPPLIDPAGVHAVDALIAFLKSRGVEVVLAHPPFNPEFFDRIRTTPYMDGLRRVEAVTRRLADTHDLRIIGSFDPYKVGCASDMFIDSEHAKPQCLSMVLDQFETGRPQHHPVVISAAPEAQPADDLALQQALIIRNARAQVLSEPSTPQLGTVVASAGLRAAPEPAISSRSVAPIGVAERQPTAQARKVPTSVRTARIEKSSAASLAVRSRRSRVAHGNVTSRELTWPGDAPSPSMRLVRSSSVER